MASDRLTAAPEKVPPQKGHLRGIDDSSAEAAGEQVKLLTEHPGWPILLDSLELYEQRLVKEHLFGRPADSQATYERLFGRLEALRTLPALAEGVIENGRDARNRRNADAA